MSDIIEGGSPPPECLYLVRVTDEEDAAFSAWDEADDQSGEVGVLYVRADVAQREKQEAVTKALEKK